MTSERPAPATSTPRAARRRTSKLIDLDAAVDFVRPGSSLCLGGFTFHNRPSAFVRALLRKARAGSWDLILYSSPSSSYDTDLLLGSGLVKKAYLASVGFEYLGLAPNYRKVWETGSVEMVECEEATLVGGLMAAVEGLPAHPIRSIVGSEIVAVSELCARRVMLDGEEWISVPAIRPDLAVLHAQQADEYGNIRYLGSAFADVLIAKAARSVVVTVDEIVDPSIVQAELHRTTLPGYCVDAVVEVPYGAHPASSHGRYLHDEEHLREYIAAADAARRDPTSDAFAAYLRRYVEEPATPAAYLERVGDVARLTTEDGDEEMRR